MSASWKSNRCTRGWRQCRSGEGVWSDGLASLARLLGNSIYGTIDTILHQLLLLLLVLLLLHPHMLLFAQILLSLDTCEYLMRLDELGISFGDTLVF